MKKNLPNVISATRFVFGILAAFSLHASNFQLFLGFIIFQAVGDKLDGFLARIWNAESDAGRVLDTLADLSFFISIFTVMAFSAAYVKFALLYVPGFALGFAVLAWRMAAGKRPVFVKRPIDHVSFILYAALVSMIYAPFAYALALMAAGAAAILLESALLLRYAIRED